MHLVGRLKPRFRGRARPDRVDRSRDTRLRPGARPRVHSLADRTARSGAGLVSANVLNRASALSNREGFLRDGDTDPPGREPVVPMVYLNAVGPGHFRTLNPAVAGRDFTHQDTGLDRRSPSSTKRSRAVLAGRDAVGHACARPGGGLNATIVVVGVARDSKYVTPTKRPRPFMYRPFAQDYTPPLRCWCERRAAASTLPAISGVVRGLDPGWRSSTSRP